MNEMTHMIPLIIMHVATSRAPYLNLFKHSFNYYYDLLLSVPKDRVCQLQIFRSFVNKLRNCTHLSNLNTSSIFLNAYVCLL